MQMCLSRSCAAAPCRPVVRRACNVSVRRAQPVQRRDVRVAFFKFGGKSGAEQAYPVSASRSDYDAEDVEHYFNYMGCLAVEGTYDRMEEMLRSGLEPVDVILLLAAAENDDPKIEELLAAGADPAIKDNRGRTPRELATKESVVKQLVAAEAKLAKA